jgi:hypothetical protein
MDNEVLSRRRFLAVSSCFGLSLLGCKQKSIECESDNSLSPIDREARAGVGYVLSADDPKKACRLCTYWISPAGDRCGGCKVLRGEIHPEGTCRLFVPIA